ncbi:MAG TPA: LysR family transcriptional regulator [Candidatus Aphodousia gallistercoris]|nr:LysR family transcriptional regulator [Candidatus Aphodousia gallistercoris]
MPDKDKKTVKPLLLHWRFFICCVELGSFQRVAQFFKTDASYVSKSIRDLEIYVGEPLLKRTRPMLSLTWIGREYYSKMKAFLSHLDVYFEKKPDPNQKDRIKIAVPSTLSKLFIRWVSAFEALYPSITADVIQYDKQMVPPVRNFDFFVALDTLPNDRVYATALGAMPRIIVTGPRYGEAARDITVPSMLNQYSLIAERNTIVMHTQHMTITLKMKLRLKVNDIISTLDSALLDKGIAVGVPLWTVAEAIQAGRLIRVLKDWSCNSEMVWLLRREALKNEQAERFISHLQQYWDQTPGLTHAPAG